MKDARVMREIWVGWLRISEIFRRAACLSRMDWSWIRNYHESRPLQNCRGFEIGRGFGIIRRAACLRACRLRGFKRRRITTVGVDWASPGRNAAIARSARPYKIAVDSKLVVDSELSVGPRACARAASGVNGDASTRRTIIYPKAVTRPSRKREALQDCRGFEIRKGFKYP